MRRSLILLTAILSLAVFAGGASASAAVPGQSCSVDAAVTTARQTQLRAAEHLARVQRVVEVDQRRVLHLKAAWDQAVADGRVNDAGTYAHAHRTAAADLRFSEYKLTEAIRYSNHADQRLAYLQTQQEQTAFR